MRQHLFELGDSLFDRRLTTGAASYQLIRGVKFRLEPVWVNGVKDMQQTPHCLHLDRITRVHYIKHYIGPSCYVHIFDISC